ncbi:MAG TPA: phosphoenolpyruvate carboxykinase (ATP) [Candidatus Acidoferrales bacterium]|nr:phosphoenolpyruvate carboxykinase (ATP) [Candidatus Acidoferrales bacterium]
MQLEERPVLTHLGVGNPLRVWRNLSTAELYEHVVRNNEAAIVSTGAVSARTGQYTGRSPRDKYFVDEPGSNGTIWWEGNQPISTAVFDQLLDKALDFVANRAVYIQDLFACADPEQRLKVRVVTEFAWHSLFASNLLIRPAEKDRERFEPDFTVISLPSLRADPVRDGTRSETFVLVNLARKMVLIGGTEYAGEIKKSVFTVLNHILPGQGIMPMHCSANVGEDGNVAAFFGLSGTGKTTLSSDPTRRLIGDDEHGWSDRGIFNFEGGCYAKTIRISRVSEPEIYAAASQFGTVLENVVFDPDSRIPDYDDGSLTENTRAAYPMSMIPGADLSGTGGHPANLVFLSADAFGVLPPVACLSDSQVKYFFLSGYTAKVAGTERGVGDPEPTFSACFAAPFLVWPPSVYADLLVEQLHRHGSRVWMINTGWVGGPYGVGSRISIEHTRSIVRAVVEGRLDDVETHVESAFGLRIPLAVPGVPSAVLNPRSAWADADAYDRQAQRLKAMFDENMARVGHSGSEAG